MDHFPITYTGLSLFSGVGMLDEAVGLALERRGIAHRVSAFCEWEASAASLLVARMAEQSVEPCPVFCGDLADFPAESFAGRIDILTAGYPCQPYSVAGKQRGLTDARAMGEDGRGPIYHLLRIIGAVRPGLVFLENVGAALEYFRPIGQELESLGYTVAPPFFCRAEDAGASHRRERIFVLAYIDGRGLRGLRQSPGSHGQSHGSDEELADGPSRGLGERRAKPGGEGSGIRGAVRSGEELADAVWIQRGERAGQERVLDGGEEMANPQSRHGGERIPQRGERDRADAGGTGEEMGHTGEHGGRPELEQGSAGESGGGGFAGASRELPAWQPCECCDDFWCNVHDCHTGECDCPEIDDWGDIDPYSPGSMAYPGGTRSEGDQWRESPHDGDGEAAHGPVAELRALPLFAPGPDSPEWPGIITRWPALAPATEPGVCLVVDGVAYPLDSARADSLRAGGNGVVALAGALAFEHSLRSILTA